jgi:hypothetical protein
MSDELVVDVLRAGSVVCLLPNMIMKPSFGSRIVLLMRDVTVWSRNCGQSSYAYFNDRDGHLNYGGCGCKLFFTYEFEVLLDNRSNAYV